MTDAQLMMELFRGSDVAHGRSEMTNKVSPKGKHEARCWAEKRAVTEKDWEQHLAGVVGVGIPPLDSNNQVRWGAIDVDVYAGLSIEALNQKIQQSKLPLVICRSKSGGPHILLFMTEPVDAAEMIEKLESIAAYLGFGKSEIFPKQVSVGEKEFGAWLNMPYFGGTAYLRYGIDQDNKALATIPGFVAYAKSRALTAEQLRSLALPEPEPLFKDGPPCLNQLFAEDSSGMRNVLLSNAAVYAKKAYPDSWRAKLDEYNRKFSEPLGSKEVEVIKESYAKKEYRYQCSKEPLCNHCDATRCRKSKYGIGNGGAVPSMRSLTKLCTEPPIFFLDVVGPDEKAHRVSFSSEQLQSPVLFQRRCMETVGLVPPIMKRPDWEDVLRELYKHIFIVEIPPELTPSGQFVELLREFLSTRGTSSDENDIARGLPFKDEDGKCYLFQMRALTSYLTQMRFTALKPNEMASILTDKLRGTRVFKNLPNGNGCRCIRLPFEEEPKQEPIPAVKFESHF